jgi:hypothetical protein
MTRELAFCMRANRELDLETRGERERARRAHLGGRRIRAHMWLAGGIAFGGQHITAVGAAIRTQGSG